MKKDTGQAQELAIIAGGKVEALFSGVLGALTALNERLVALRGAIRESQKGQTPLVLLALYGCGDKCSGCPHPRWMHFSIVENKDGKTMPKGVTLAKTGQDPVLLLPRKNTNFRETATLIREAKEVLRKRKDLLGAIKKLGQRAGFKQEEGI